MRAFTGWVLGFTMAVAASPALAGDPVDYMRDVKPILTKKCISCHGPTKPKGKLRLDTAAFAAKGGTSGPAVVAGNVDDSLLIERVIEEDEATRMPLKRPALAAAEVDTLRRWVEQGAKAPSDEAPAAPHWAFTAPKRPVLPVVIDRAWCRNPIDQFILARLEREKIKPAPEADRITLIRRLSLDLLGLPPTPAEVDAFLADDRVDAYEQLVDRLLASPHYGERWGRLWLDMARYADSNGYSIDAPRSIWKYRDWVIDAFNRDMPFDQFTIDQIAGDLRPNASMDQKVATGFHRNTPINQEGGIDLEQFRVESIVDRVNTTSSVWLGLTIGCAQCHDHKFDPIAQKDYYRLFAFFNNVDEPEMPLASPEQLAERDRIEGEVEAYLKKIQEDDATLVEKTRAWEDGLDMAGRQKQSQEVRSAFDVLPDMRNAEQKKVVFAAFIDQDKSAREHKKHIATLRKKMPKIVTTMVVRERTKDPRETHLMIQGDFTRKGDVMTPGVPAVLPELAAGASEADRLDRMDLARWMVDARNPLTARVNVNRMWQAHFGRGLVETENDLGTQGLPPTHPELLDWLATEFVAQGWSTKAMHRLMVCSATYRQSSRVRPELASVDPSNRLLARQGRLRLDAELVRDAALAACGRLNEKIGGPSVFPPQPDGVMTLGQLRRPWQASKGPDRYRRGMYTYFWRATPHPLFTVFDAPDGTHACTRRLVSNTPLQALTLLNDEAFFEFAQALAERVLREAPDNDADRLRLAFRLCLARSPQAIELEQLSRLLTQERESFAADQDSAKAVLPAADQDKKDEKPAADPATHAAWVSVARVLLNLDEFITRE